MLKHRLTASAFLLPIFVFACASTPESDGPREDPLVGNATLSTRDSFAVGVCQGALGADGTCGGDDVHMCSATLILPNLVLTAQHCVRATNPTPPANVGPGSFCRDTYAATPDKDGGTRVTTATAMQQGHPTWRDVKNVFVPGVRDCADDIALLELADPIGATEAAPADVDITTDDATVKDPRSFTIVGYGGINEHFDVSKNAKGETVLGDSTLDVAGGQRRVRQNIPTYCVSDVPGVCFRTDYAGIEEAPNDRFDAPPELLIAGRAVATGDSGAGFFDQGSYVGGGRPAVAGVTTMFTLDRDGTSNSSISVRLSAHADWMAKKTRDVATPAGIPVPAWATKR